MAIREIYFTVTSGGISPNTEQQAGIQSEHAATSLIFTIDSALYQSLNDGKDTTDTIVYRFDCFDSTGGVVRTEAKPLSNRAVSLTLGENLTRNGGKAKVYLVISRFNAELKTEVELLSYPAKLRFENLPEASENSGESAESISTLTEVAKEAANKASESATVAATAAIKAETATQAAESAVEKANTATQAAESAVRKANETLAKTEAELSEHNTSDTAHKDIRETVEKVSGELSEKQDKFAEVDEYGNITMSDISSGTSIVGKYGGGLDFDNTNGSVTLRGRVGATLRGNYVSLQCDNGSLDVYDDGIYLSDLKIIGVKTPTKDNEAANKGYVDSLIGDMNTTLAALVDVEG